MEALGRVCSKCGILQPWTNFFKSKNGTNGYHSSCKTCFTRVSQPLRKERNLVLKRAAFAAYGKVCSCCGESTFEFLTIDHINGGGAKHRKEIGVSRMYKWLSDNEYPSGFQVLCYNCNCGRRLTDSNVCPHKL